MFTPLAYLERNPTYKEQITELGEEKNLLTFGFLGYPVLQAADILIYKAEAVPVGIDQVPHVELTREIARKFNGYYGEVFPEPQALLTESPKLLGLDNRKMSKSYGNAIFLTDSEKETLQKVSQMITDPARVRRNDPGHPDICNVFSFHKIWNTSERVQEIESDCISAALGCVECKKECGRMLNEALADYRKKFKEIYSDKNKIRDIIITGKQQAQSVAKETMAEVRKAIRLV
jgi:tryptophanyl-tRNA synthetase